ncbi:Chaperone protein papD precursor [Serratia fonticola]|uniref:Chaperone protein papD n=1 Tax=Serratia fonticola TaxID=47917 RepID=A0A4V6KX03_SERFO|nr:Chaperone protein papD precursor [Serratia fonticola]
MSAAKKTGPGVKGFEPDDGATEKADLPLTVSAASVGGNPVLTYINDYGGRPQLSFSCNGSTCTVMPEKKA